AWAPRIAANGPFRRVAWANGPQPRIIALCSRAVSPSSRQPRRERRRTATRVHVLALRDCTPLVSVGVLDMLRKASQLAESIPGVDRRPRLDATLVAPGSKSAV